MPLKYVGLRKDVRYLGELSEDNPHSVVIAVHPFFIWSNSYPPRRAKDFLENMDRNIIIGRADPSQKKISKFVKTYKGPIIVLEGVDSVQRTAKVFEILGKTNDTYFVSTENQHPEPLVGWDPILTFLTQFRQPFQLIGGYRTGCLEITQNTLEGIRSFKVNGHRFKTEVLEDLTF